MSEHSMILLNEMGDIEIYWDDEHSEQMRALIERKMNEGIRFFILKPVPLTGDRLHMRSKLQAGVQIVSNVVIVRDRDLSRLGVSASRINVEDPDLSDLAAKGVVKFRGRPRQSTLETVGLAKTADQVLQNHTVGTRQYVGG